MGSLIDSNTYSTGIGTAIFLLLQSQPSQLIQAFVCCYEFFFIHFIQKSPPRKVPSITCTMDHQLLLLNYLLLLPTVVRGTYSIVATDATTRQVGGAGATCLKGRDIYEALYRSVPNSSVLHTQGLLVARDDPIVTTALDMMQKNNESLNAIMEEMQDLDKNSIVLDDSPLIIQNVQLRQYTIANFTSQAGYSGGRLAFLWEYFGYGTSEVVNVGYDLLNGRYTYRAAGNVVKVGTVDSMQNGFENQDDQFNFGLCDMAGKLMTAMYRVADGGYGDDRCLNADGTTATGAYLHIDNANGTEFIHINIIDPIMPKEPVEELKKQFLEWRKQHPCDKSQGAVFGLEIQRLFKGATFLVSLLLFL